MGESLYLAFFIWSVVYFAEFARQPGDKKASRSLIKCGLCLAAACLTRYDGWFLAAVMVLAVLAVSLSRKDKDQDRNDNDLKSKVKKNGARRFPASASRVVLAKFILLAVIAPVLWLAYNAIVYRNPLEFANGPYSAKAIEQETATVNPAKGNVIAAGAYFLKATQLNVGEASWQGRLWLALALLGSLSAAFGGSGRVALVLWAPLPFYALSVAYGSIPIFVPAWWPFTNYNLRYGLQLLPAFAVFVPLGIAVLVNSAVRVTRLAAPGKRWAPVAVALVWLALVADSDSGIWRADPICYREALINMRGRVALDRQLADWLKSLPPDSTLLMFLGQHSGAFEQAGVPLRRVINEGNHRMWKQPADAEGLWERALADPAAYADYVIGFEGDRVWTAARNQQLPALVEIHTTGQPAAVIFQGRVPAPARP